MSASAAVVAPRERLFEALNNRDVLRRCIPGCEELTAEGSDTYRGGSSVGRRPHVAVRRQGHVSESEPPESFTLAFEGKGKTGFVRGTAAVSIADDQGTARVDCEADVQVGGAIAAVGSRRWPRSPASSRRTSFVGWPAGSAPIPTLPAPQTRPRVRSTANYRALGGGGGPEVDLAIVRASAAEETQSGGLCCCRSQPGPCPAPATCGGLAFEGIVFSPALPLMFAVGLGLHGRLFPFHIKRALVGLAAFANLGIGVPYFIAGASAWVRAKCARSRTDGNAFLIVVGLLNLLVVIDVYGIAVGRK